MLSNTPSPNTVLDGSYVGSGTRSIRTFSFRKMFFFNGGSFRSGRGSTPEKKKHSSKDKEEVDVVCGSPAATANPSYEIFNRFRAQVRSLQGDLRTFGEEPGCGGLYSVEIRVDLGAKRGEIENFVETNGETMRIYERLVPGKIDDGTFWLRYFYGVNKLEQAESLRDNLVKRAISSEEEELSWDEHYNDDDDKKVVKLDDKEGHPSGVVKDEGCRSNATNPASSVAEEVRDGWVDATIAGGKVDVVDADKEEGSVSGLFAGRQVVVDSVTESSIEGDANTENGLDAITKSFEQGSDQNTNYTDKTDEESDYVAILSRPVVSEEEDLGWDEIEDLSSIDNNSRTTKSAQGADPSFNREELWTRLTIAEEEEDLSWDIEDNDAEPAKP